ARRQVRYRGRCPQARRMSARGAWCSEPPSSGSLSSESWTSDLWTSDDPWTSDPWPSTAFDHCGFADVVQVSFLLRLIFLGEHLFADFPLLRRVDLGRFPLAQRHHLHALFGDF